MATIHTSGTQLENQRTRLPLNKACLASLAVVFLLAMHFFMPNPGGSGLALSFNPTTWLALSFTLAIGFYQLATNRVLKYSKLNRWLADKLRNTDVTHSLQQRLSSSRIWPTTRIVGGLRFVRGASAI